MHVLISLADGCVVCSPRFRCLCFGAFLRLAPKAHDRFESCVPIDSSSNMLDVTVQRSDLNQSSGLGSDAMTCNDDTDVALFWPKD